MTPDRHTSAHGNGAAGDYRQINIQKTDTINAETSCLFETSIEVNIARESIYKTVLHDIRFCVWSLHPFLRSKDVTISLVRVNRGIS